MGILVIEAMYRSGTSVTAKLAISQNRKVFALPHEIWDSHGVGTNRLIKNGAILVTDTEDILQEFKSLRKLYKKFENIKKINIDNLNSKNNSNLSDNSINNTINDSSDITKKKKLGNPKFKSIYDLICTEPISINEICKKTSKSISEVSNILFSLELNGYIKKVAGGYICILIK